MNDGVMLALLIAFTSVLFFGILVAVVLLCVYQKKINEAFNPLEFDNEEHDAKKSEKQLENQCLSNEQATNNDKLDEN